MLNRRKLLAQTAGFAVMGLSLGKAAAKSLPGIEKASMRGSINATELGVQPGALDDQSKAFARLLRDASDRDMPVFLPPGTYVVSNLSLPGRIRLSGVPGASRIVYGGNGHLLMAEQAEHIEFTGLVFDGSNRWMADYAQGLLDLRRVGHLVVDNCQITGSGKNGLALEHASGRVERSEISGAADAGIYSVEAGGLAISGNTVSD
ncbi:MAG: TIGR03808 family TAT-translocated repetitive protein, partial [Mesorhizobium sp.]